MEARPMAQISTPVCCVDHTRPGTRAIAGRWFCDEHYAKATYKRGGVWRSEIIAVIGLLVFVAAVFGLDYALRPELTGTTLLVTGIVLSIVPAAIWLTFFYQQDRLEPEPVANVVRMFVIGLALAGALGIPLTEQFFKVQDWLYIDSTAGIGLTEILGSIFVTGAVEAFVIFATVRYFIFDQPEFDERTDGVVYATAAALGYATALNFQFILASGGAALGGAEIYVAEVALAHAAIGGLLGYFLGKAKLEQEPLWWLPLGLALAAALTGTFNILRGQLDVGGIGIGASSGLPAVNGLLLAGGLAIVVALVVYVLINRDITRSLSSQQSASTVDPSIGDRQASFAALGAIVVLLLIGTFAWTNATNRTTAFNKEGFQGAYPAYFSDATGEGEILHVMDTLGTGAEFIITARPTQGANAESIAAQLAGDRGTDYAIYKVHDRSFVTLSNSSDLALTQRFTAVSGGSLTGTDPELHDGIDYIIIKGDQAIVITLLADPDDLPDLEPLFARFLNGLSF